MTYWKVDLLKPAEGVPKTHWFRNSHDAEQFCDRIPCSPYATSYYCREVRIPNQILDAVRREALKRVNASKAPPAPEASQFYESEAHRRAKGLPLHSDRHQLQVNSL